MNRRYAVLFKAFTFDPFVARQLSRTVTAAPGGDVFFMIDETRAPGGEIEFDRVIRYRESDVLNLGFPGISVDSLFWYNADYPLYYFHHLRPEYDFVVMIEYDAVVNVNLDILVDTMRQQELDLVGHGVEKTDANYWWTHTMLRFYDRAVVRPYLICVSAFSVKAIKHLAACRLRHAESGVRDPEEWPIGECLVGTELALANFRIGDLADFGSLKRYDWWPPMHERELRRLTGEAVIHPVLVGRRFAKSLFKSNFKSGVIATGKFLLRQLVHA